MEYILVKIAHLDYQFNIGSTSIQGYLFLCIFKQLNWWDEAQIHFPKLHGTENIQEAIPSVEMPLASTLPASLNVFMKSTRTAWAIKVIWILR